MKTSRHPKNLNLCPLFFTIFKRKMYFFVISNEVDWKEI